MADVEITKWIHPENRRKAILRARDRANAAKWDLDVAVFLFGILATVFILAFEGVSIWIIAPVAIFGLSMVWLIGWRRARQVYGRFLDEQLEQRPDDWKDYYKILRIGPNAESKTITEACERLSQIYHEALSDQTKRIPLYSLLLREADEAYKVLSDPTSRSAYDHIFWLKSNIARIETDESAKYELLHLSQSISQEVSKVERGITWKVPLLLSKITRQVVLGAVIAMLVMLGGTSLAFAKPEHALATPFRGVAIGLIKTSVGAIGLIEDIRGIVATHERSVVSTALQTMRIEEGLKRVPPVVAPINDMTYFPSREHPLFPDYLETRFSQFKYTVDSKGIVSVDTSWATTDAWLENIKRLLERLEKKRTGLRHRALHRL